MSLLNEKPVAKVREALTAADHEDTVTELEQPVSSTVEAAAALGSEPGAVIQVMVFKIDKRFVMALVAGDHVCKEYGLPRALDLEGAVTSANAGEMRGATGFPEGGISPVGLPFRLPMVIDRSLKRFETLYVPAGHPQCFFSTTVAGLKRLTGGIVSYNIAEPA